jgi:hypothetical protein
MPGQHRVTGVKQDPFRAGRAIIGGEVKAFSAKIEQRSFRQTSSM